MARRSRYPKEPGETSTLGFGPRNEAFNRLAKLRDGVITATVTFEREPMRVIELLYDADKRRILREACGMVNDIAYPRFALTPHVSVRFQCECFTKHHMAAPLGGASLDITAAAPLLKSINAAVCIIDNFAMVKHVVRWLDRNASLNAIRHYFPAMLSLVPEGHKLPHELSDRYVEPQGIGKYVPLIRDAASIVASALVLPEPVSPGESVMQLEFAGGNSFTRYNVEIDREAVFIKL